MILIKSSHNVAALFVFSKHHFVIGVTEIPKEQTAEDESKSALRAFNLYKGKYKKNPTGDFKAKMLEAYSRVADPKVKLTEELKELGVMG